ncbi:MAG: hypothetical protein M0Q53_00735 [Prolixibacteraceae bacterium]|jgi:hypothetical protein|nr:hypothetical protein [Prolixibacteraceae bacterium]
MIQKKLTLSLFYLFFLSFHILVGQPVEKLIKIFVVPDHANWVYQLGETARFSVTVMKNSQPIQNVKIKYEVGPEMMAPIPKDSVILKDGQFRIEGGTMKESGFLRCKVSAIVEGVRYENLATAAFVPEQIKPTTEFPAEFLEFWNNAKAEAAKIPMDAKLTGREI